ncbi:unnamed protein product, partial [Phaeothamnion confervicola]
MSPSSSVARAAAGSVSPSTEDVLSPRYDSVAGGRPGAAMAASATGGGSGSAAASPQPGVDSPRGDSSNSGGGGGGGSGLFLHRLRDLVEECMACGENHAMTSSGDGTGGGSSGPISPGRRRLRDGYAAFCTAVRDAALEAWGQGLTLFFPQHHDRHALLMALLVAVPPATMGSTGAAAGDTEDAAVTVRRRRQLNALCIRLAEPALAEGFVMELAPPDAADGAAAAASALMPAPLSPTGNPTLRRGFAGSSGGGASGAGGGAGGSSARRSDVSGGPSPVASAAAVALESLSAGLLSGAMTREGVLNHLRALLPGGAVAAGGGLPGVDGGVRLDFGTHGGAPGSGGGAVAAAAAVAVAAASAGADTSLAGEEAVQRLCSAVAAGKSVSVEYTEALRIGESVLERRVRAEEALCSLMTMLVERLALSTGVEGGGGEGAGGGNGNGG